MPVLGAIPGLGRTEQNIRETSDGGCVTKTSN